jgi:hypothetical protein
MLGARQSTIAAHSGNGRHEKSHSTDGTRTHKPKSRQIYWERAGQSATMPPIAVSNSHLPLGIPAVSESGRAETQKKNRTDEQAWDLSHVKVACSQPVRHRDGSRYRSARRRKRQPCSGRRSVQLRPQPRCDRIVFSVGGPHLRASRSFWLVGCPQKRLLPGSRASAVAVHQSVWPRLSMAWSKSERHD